MAEYKHNYVNVTVLGRMNPQILTHDWLVKTKIITKRVFVTKDSTQPPFSQFISTPPMTHLAYGPLVFTVDENKFVLTDSKARGKTKIYDMTQKYFSKLSHTPLTKIGFNVQGIVTFSTRNEEKKFDGKYISCGEALREITIGKNERLGFSVRTKKDKAIYILTCTKHPEEPKVILNSNCEFCISDSQGLSVILLKASEFVQQLSKQQKEMAII